MSKKQLDNGTVPQIVDLPPPPVEVIDVAPPPPPPSARNNPLIRGALEVRERRILDLKAAAFELGYEMEQLQREIDSRRERQADMVQEIRRNLSALAAERAILDIVG